MRSSSASTLQGPSKVPTPRIDEPLCKKKRRLVRGLKEVGWCALCATVSLDRRVYWKQLDFGCDSSSDFSSLKGVGCEPDGGGVPRRGIEAKTTASDRLVFCPRLLVAFLGMSVRLPAPPALNKQWCTALHISHSSCTSHSFMAQYALFTVSRGRLYRCSSPTFRAYSERNATSMHPSACRPPLCPGAAV